MKQHFNTVGGHSESVALLDFLLQLRLQQVNSIFQLLFMSFPFLPAIVLSSLAALLPAECGS